MSKSFCVEHLMFRVTCNVYLHEASVGHGGSIW